MRGRAEGIGRAAAAVAALALAAAGCGAGVAAGGGAASGAGGGAGSPGAAEGAGAVTGPPRPPCPAGSTNCRSASGTILYVERVDPDGDGDAHFVLLSPDSVTAPGISVIDVERDLRPHPLPGPGARVSAAGPVYRGSYGQRQIQATVVRLAGRG
ncbi:MAG: hypothetical protein U0R52_11525 [Solirubrobacterales bacterium]